MIDFDGLARWLVACQKHPDENGCIVVSLADAIRLRSLGFATVEPGRWKVPPEISRRYPALAVFITAAPAAPAAPEMPARPPVVTPPVPVTPPRAPVEVAPVDRLTWRRHDALRHADQMRVSS